MRSAQGPSTTCGKQPALLESIAGLHLVGLVPTHTKRALATGCLQACSLFWGRPRAPSAVGCLKHAGSTLRFVSRGFHHMHMPKTASQGAPCLRRYQSIAGGGGGGVGLVILAAAAVSMK